MPNASIWEPGTVITVSNVNKQQFTATQGQVLFTLTTFSYAVGTQTINVYRNGLLQMPTTYAETSSTKITFNAGSECVAGDDILITAVTL